MPPSLSLRSQQHIYSRKKRDRLPAIFLAKASAWKNIAQILYRSLVSLSSIQHLHEKKQLNFLDIASEIIMPNKDRVTYHVRLSSFSTKLRTRVEPHRWNRLADLHFRRRGQVQAAPRFLCGLIQVV